MTGERVPRWKYAICNELFEGWPLARAASFAAELGYKGLELAPYTLAKRVVDLTAADRRRIREDVEGAGLKVAALHWLLARTEGLQLNDPDPAVRERTASYLLELIDFCADVGGDVLVFGSPQQRNIPEGYPPERAWDNSVAIMRRCGEWALARGVVFCIEPLRPEETNFVNSVDQAAELVQRVDHPGFRMMVDVKAMSADPRPVPELLRLVFPLIRHIHVNDPNRLGPGMGEVDFRPILQTLCDLGYDGWLSVEAFDFTPGCEHIARCSIANLCTAAPQ